MYRSLIRAAVYIGILTAAAYSQFNFSYLNSNSVRNGKRTGTRIDSVLIETTVGNGIAKTHLTFSVEPQGYYSNTTIQLPTTDTIWYTVTRYNAQTGLNDSIGRSFWITSYRTIWDTIPEELDSVEISRWFKLPTDFVARNMWLWINGKPEKAYIQDKMLAEQQYNQIVGRRQDPALLTYNGNGSYMFRMFPLKSFVARKVAIEFEHTFSDSNGVIAASIPVCFDTTNAYWYWNRVNTHKSGIGHVTVLLKTTDSKTYTFSMPGVGVGTFSKDNGLTLKAGNVTKMGVGNISAANPAGHDVYAWSSVTADGSNSEIGFSTLLAESTVVLSPEPETRIIVMDIHQKMWSWADYYKAYYAARGSTSNESIFTDSYYLPFDLWAHAQKLAVLALKSYVDKNKKFNLIINGKLLFEKPVEGTASHLATAFAAIVAGSYDSNASTVDALKTAISQGNENAIILISDYMMPPDALIQSKYNSTSPGNPTIDTNESARHYIAQTDSCKNVTGSFKGNLFVICDDDFSYSYSNSLTQIAYSTGGCQLTNLRNAHTWLYSNASKSDGTSEKLPRLSNLYANRTGISDVKVTFADGSSSDLTFTVDGYSYWWSGWGGFSGAIMWYPYRYYGDQCRLRVAFKSPGTTSKVSMIISGKMGCLRFTKNVTLQPDIEKGSSSEQWAFRNAEHLAQKPWNSSYDWSYWKTLQDSIKAIGYKYHIVTTNTALLALEPGMTLTVDSANATAQSEANGVVAAYSVVSGVIKDGSTSENGWDINTISLQDLISDKIIASGRPLTQFAEKESFSIKVNRSQIMLSVPAASRDQNLKLAIYNLAGQLIASKFVPAKEAQNSQVLWDLSSTTNKLCNGAFVMKIKAGSKVKVLKMPSLR